MRGQAVADRDRRLGRVPDRQLLGARVPLGHHAAVLDRRRGAAVVAEAARDDDVGRARAPPRSRPSAAPRARPGSSRGRSWISGAPGASAASRSTTASSGSTSTHDVAQRVLGDVAALGHDHRDRLADVAHLVLAPAAPACARGRPARRSAAAAPAAARASSSRRGPRRCRPRRTPGRARAPPRRRRRGGARARTALRRKATCSMPGSCTSSTNSARPVSRRASSLRGTRAPR